MTAAIALIHADATLRNEIRNRLGREGFTFSEASELRPAEIGSPEAVLIDWQALSPVARTLNWLRQEPGEASPRVLVLANADDYGVAVASLESGADDCVRLPLQGDELLIRLRACLGRPQATLAGEPLSAGPIVLDRNGHRVQVGSSTVELAPTEFRLLAFLLENQGRVFSRGELLAHAWSRDVKAGHRTVDVHVRRLRQQLEPYQCEDMIQTVRGFGYRLRVDGAADRRNWL